MEDITDITTQIFSFKEVMRHLWNAGFVANLEHVDYDDVADFQDIAVLLFVVLVLRSCDLDVEFNRYGSRCRDIFVVPASALSVVPLMQECGQKGRWQEKIVTVDDFGSPKFMEFFDWKGFSQADFPYVRCWSERQSCEYLIEQQNCKFSLSST